MTSDILLRKIAAKSALIGLGVVLLSGCASTPETTEVATTPPPSPVTPPAPVQQDQAEIVPVAPVAPVIAQPVPPVSAGAIPGSIEDFNAQAGDRIFFGYDQYSLTAQARNVLRNQAQWLNNYPAITAVIGGNCDERGTREYNLALGARRADAVKDFLVSQGVDPSRLTTVSYGKERPIDGRSNEQAWALNRNAQTAIVTINS